MRVLLLLLLAAITLVQTRKSVKLARKHDSGCADIKKTKWCLKVLHNDQCDIPRKREKCLKTCGVCEAHPQDCIGEDCCLKMKECEDDDETHNCDYFHNKCIFSRLCDFHCDHGTCEDGICKCDDPFMGPYCRERRCTFTSCGEHGTCGEDGKCLCNDGYYGTFSCSLDKRVLKYDKIWSSATCERESPSELSLSECITHCVDVDDCDAFTYKESDTAGTRECTLLKCVEAVPVPEIDFPPYKAYILNRGTSDQDVCEADCVQGTCSNGRCECDTDFFGTDCREECISSVIDCGSKSGFCRMERCNNLEIEMPTIRCSDNCENYKCCIPIDKIISSSYDNIWGEDDQCESMEKHFVAQSFVKCIEKCLKIGCNAINYKSMETNNGKNCYLSFCTNTAPTSTSTFLAGYKGYSINKGTLCDVIHCDHGTCEDGTCNCDSGYHGTYCTELGCINCDGHGTCEDNGICTCDYGYFNNDEHSCSAGCTNCDERGVCKENGECECEEGHYTAYIHTCSQCTPVSNACVENGGFCRKDCHDKEIYMETVTCYDTCDFKCCMPSHMLYVKYAKTWSRNQCSTMYFTSNTEPDSTTQSSFEGITVTECISKCLSKDLCTVISYSYRSNIGTCKPLECDPVPEPEEDWSSYRGYAINKEKMCEIYCDHGNCENGICICESSFTGTYCTEISASVTSDQAVCTARCAHGTCTDGVCECESGYHGTHCREVGCTNCNGHGTCEDNGECICDDGYFKNDEHSCSAGCTTCDEHGTCMDNGECICNERYYADDIHSCSQCTPVSNPCVEKGGICRWKCRDNEEYMSTVTCYENCQYRCCFPSEELVVEHDKTWSEEQCSTMPYTITTGRISISHSSYEGIPLAKCISKCLATDLCTVISYDSDTNNGTCKLLQCETIPVPDTVGTPYLGYAIDKDKMCYINCRNGHCGDGICICDSGFTGDYCTES